MLDLVCKTCGKVYPNNYEKTNWPEGTFFVWCNWCYYCEEEAEDYFSTWASEEPRPEPTAANQLNLFGNQSGTI